MESVVRESATKLVDGSTSAPKVTIPGPGRVTVGLATIVNPGVVASVVDVALRNATGAELVGVLGHNLGSGTTEMPLGFETFPPPTTYPVEELPIRVPVSEASGEDLLPSLQLLLGVDLEAGGSFDGVDIIWEDVSGNRHELVLNGAAKVA
jgi:hypothetical protein